MFSYSCLFCFPFLFSCYQILSDRSEFRVKGLLLGFCVLLYSGELPPVAKGLYGDQKDAYFPYFGA
jgi:hypothetical protein